MIDMNNTIELPEPVAVQIRYIKEERWRTFALVLYDLFAGDEYERRYIYTEQQVRELLATGGQSAETTKGATNEATVLPDGSAFAVYSYPLPKDHWLYAPREYEQGAEEPKELAAPILTHAAHEQVVSAIRYAVRAATDCGKETDFDPDALVQNAVYALCGPFNKNQPQPQTDERDLELLAAVVYASAEAMNSSIESPSFDGSIILESHHAASLSLALEELEQHRAAIAAAKENK